MRAIVGRKNDLATLEELYNSDKSHFVAVYGRRRVGKTFLIRSAFEGRITFQVTGLSNTQMIQQIANFNLSLRKVVPEHEYESANDWFSVFQQLSSITCSNRFLTNTKNILP